MVLELPSSQDLPHSGFIAFRIRRCIATILGRPKRKKTISGIGLPSLIDAIRLTIPRLLNVHIIQRRAYRFGTLPGSSLIISVYIARRDTVKCRSCRERTRTRHVNVSSASTQRCSAEAATSHMQRTRSYRRPASRESKTRCGSCS